MTLANEIFLGGGNSKVLLAIISNYKKMVPVTANSGPNVFNFDSNEEQNILKMRL